MVVLLSYYDLFAAQSSGLAISWAGGKDLSIYLCDVIMEEWKRTPVATCEALVNSMHKRIKAVLENNGGLTKY